MIVAIDVHYKADYAKAVVIQFECWFDQAPNATYVTQIHDVAEYTSREFYKRELPCILNVLTKVTPAIRSL